MARDRRSFFERLTGSVSVDDYDYGFEEESLEDAPARAAERPAMSPRGGTPQNGGNPPNGGQDWMEEEASEGQLAIDMYQHGNEIVIRALVAGVMPSELDVAITRDMVTIRGKREGQSGIAPDDYFYQELYWGSFSRTILLPVEVEAEEAEATEKHGLLIIRLPKIDKERQTRLKVKAG